MANSSTKPSSFALPTMFSTSTSLSPVRPEARRAYGEDMATGTGVSAEGGPGQVRSGGSRGGEAEEGRQERRETALLQQAANYASLAGLPPSTSSLLVGERQAGSGTQASATINSAPTTGAQPLKRRLTRPKRSSIQSRATAAAAAAAAPTATHSAPLPVGNDELDDVEECYDAPRLSISSAESSGGSEVKTPESINAPASWVHVQEQRKRVGSNESTGLAVEGQGDSKSGRPPCLASLPHHPSPQSIPPPSPPIVDFTQGLAEAGFDRAASSTRRQRNSRLMHAALELGKEEEQEEEQEQTLAQEQERGVEEGAAQSDGEQASLQSRSSSGLTSQSRASTIRAKRPTTLLRLPSARTDETAHPSPPSSSSLPSTAGVTPAAAEDNSYGKARDPMERAQVTTNGQGRLASSLRVRGGGERAGGAGVAESLSAMALSHDSSSGSESDEEQTPDLSSSRGLVASPDSWRSLLPEHDPFFISSETLSTATSSRAASLVGAATLSQRLSYQSQASSSGGGHAHESSESQSSSQAATNNNSQPNEREKRRLSSESMQSCFSLPGPTAASMYASSNASGSLYDLDGTFNTSGSRAAFAPLQYHYNQSSKSLASPLLQTCLYDSESGRSSTPDERQEPRFKGQESSAGLQAASRRHASFSAFDSPSKGHGSMSHSSGNQSQHGLGHPDQHDRSRPFAGRFQHPLAASVLSSSPEGRGLEASGNKRSSLVNGMSPSSPGSALAMGNEGERERWPSSRNSLQGWQAGLCAAQSPVQTFDPFSVDQRLADDFKSSLRDETIAVGPPVIHSPPALLSTSTSTRECVAADANGLPIEHRLLTTTTTTTLTTTTTTVLSSPNDTATLPLGSPPAATDYLASKRAPAQRSMSMNHKHQKPSTKGEPTAPTAAAPFDVSPLSPPSLPFLDSRPAPASTDFSVETHSSHYTLKTKLPGFGIDGITLATKHHRQLVIVADKWDESNGGHFERRITFGSDADLRCTRANFDGTLLRITVPRRS